MTIIRAEPYTFQIDLTDWGWKVSGKSDAKGDLSILEDGEHEPPITAEASSELWDLLDERVFQRKSDAKTAVRNWLRNWRM